jgi:hypothetical protein
MLHARVIRPPNAGCNPVAVDESSLKGIPGARVVREKDFLAVVADREWDAVRAAEALKITWSGECAPFPPMEKLHQYIRDAKPNASGAPVNRGDVEAALGKASRVHRECSGRCNPTPAWDRPARRRHGERRAASVDRLAKPHYGRVSCAMLAAAAEKVRATWGWPGRGRTTPARGARCPLHLS